MLYRRAHEDGERAVEKVKRVVEKENIGEVQNQARQRHSVIDTRYVALAIRRLDDITAALERADRAIAMSIIREGKA